MGKSGTSYRLSLISASAISFKACADGLHSSAIFKRLREPSRRAGSLLVPSNSPIPNCTAAGLDWPQGRHREPIARLRVTLRKVDGIFPIENCGRVIFLIVEPATGIHKPGCSACREREQPAA